MNKTCNKFIVSLLIASFFVFPLAGVGGRVQAQDSYPPALEMSLSADGLTAYNAVPPLVIVVDPNPAMQGIKIPTLEADKALADPSAVSAAFSFTYVPNGSNDLFGQSCTTFPDNVKTAFNAAAAIWTSKLQSPVPITILACWADLSSPTTLGYSGGGPSHRDFSGAPMANTWYEASLANALSGSDLAPALYDMSITFNLNFAWYTGTDSNPPGGQFDMVTVAAHEIGHGLNFSGTADYSGGTGYQGTSGYPNIYDTFMENGAGTKLTTYTNPSVALGSLLTSNDLWFDGSNANAANSGARVKIHAPSSWNDGSSYGHLDDVFNGTVNDMMTFSVPSGSANHNPGPVTLGMLKDLGWVLTSSTPPGSFKIYLPLVLKNYPPVPGAFNKSAPVDGATGQPANPTLSWGASSNASSYEYCIDASNNSVCDTTWISTAGSTSIGLSGLTPATYYWQVRANNTAGATYANTGTWWSFTAASNPSGPTAGLWQSTSGEEFYVTADQANVDNFAVYVNTGCGNYKITHLPLLPIVGSQFSFSGTFYASGIFDSATSAHGTDGLDSYLIGGCGLVSGGPWSWTATWINSSQPPAIVVERSIPSIIDAPALQMPAYFHTITITQ